MKNILQVILSSIAFVLLFNISVFAQFNPVSDLQYEQSYDYGNSFCPSYNCFYLSWGLPDISSDTLLGYNVYRNDELYLFTESACISCDGMGPCGFGDFYDLFPFWVKVKAVYNTEQIESIANDSIHVCDFMINIDKIDFYDINLLKNPISVGENITLFFPDSDGDYLIKVLSLNGQLIKEHRISKNSPGSTSFSSINMTAGIYIINIETKCKTISKKLIIE